MTATNQRPLPDRKHILRATGFILLATFICYLPALRAGFIWDDDSMLTANPLVRSPDGLRAIWFSTQATDYWPLTYSTLWLEWRLWGMNATGYHATNIILHALNAILLWRVLQNLRIPGAWFAALIFAVHPVNVESVAWITERKNTLAMFFLLLSLLWYLRSQRARAGDPKLEASSADSRYKIADSSYYWFALLAFVVSLLAKTSGVMLPFVLLLYHWWYARVPQATSSTERETHSSQGSMVEPSRFNWKGLIFNPRIFVRVAPFFAASLVLGLITIWFQTNRAMGGDIVRADNFASRLAVAGRAVWFYLYKALIPLNLSFVYPRWEIPSRSIVVFLPLLGLAGCFVVFWKYRRTWGRAALFGFGSFILMLLPVLGFFNIYFHRYSLVADHWQYFSLPAIVALAVSAMSLARGSRQNSPQQMLQIWRQRIAGAVIVAALLFLSWRQTHLYADNGTLWRDTLRKNPNCWLALNNLGLESVEKGDLAEAKALHLQSLALKPDQIEAHNNLGEVFLAEGKMAEAKQQYLAALAINPRFAMSHYNLGNVLDREGKREEAMTSYRRALELFPTYPEAHNNLGCLLAAEGKLNDAITHFHDALRQRPDFPDALNNLGSTLTEQGRPAEAVQPLRRAIQLKPDYADAHYNLGNASLALKNPRESFREYQIALNLNPQHASAHYKIGNLFLGDGNSDAASAHYRAALTQNPNSAEAHYQLATILVARKETVEGIRHYREAVRLKPDWVEALNNLAWILATDANDKLREGGEAVRLAQHVVELVGNQNAGAMDTLAAALAEAGRWSDATNVAQQAIAAAAGDKQLTAEIQERLKLYRSSQPVRQ